MKILHTIVANTLINGFILYLIAKYASGFGFDGFAITPSVSIEIMIVLWFIFWVVYFVIRNFIKIITLPIRWLSLWLLTVFINVWMFYFFQWFVNYLDINIDGSRIAIHLWTFLQIIVLSIIVYFLNLILKNN